jgi:hypothetical protein
MDKQTIKLREIAYARSGDKGSNANIGVIAYSEAGYEFLKYYLKSKLVGEYFKELHPSKTLRYELPNLFALNFVLIDVLDGGGSHSLRIDAQGKALGQALLELKLKIPKEILKESKRPGA